MQTAHRRNLTLIFDLDGTLVDSRRGILACFRHPFDALQRPSPSDAALAASIGQPFRQVLAEFLGTADEVLVEHAVALYRDRYGKTGVYEATLYDGIAEMLQALNGHALFVATSKAHFYATTVVQHFGLTKYFRGVLRPRPGWASPREGATARSHSSNGPDLR